MTPGRRFLRAHQCNPVHCHAFEKPGYRLLEIVFLFDQIIANVALLIPKPFTIRQSTKFLTEEKVSDTGYVIALNTIDEFQLHEDEMAKMHYLATEPLVFECHQTVMRFPSWEEPVTVLS